MSERDDYVLARGAAGEERLELLARAMWPSTRAVLARAGVGDGWRCLDVGCGVGAVTCELAALAGRATGVDLDEGFVRRARARAAELGRSGAGFQVASVFELDRLGRRFDLVYARYLLSHLRDPAAALRAMVAAAEPGGVVVVEDIDFTGHFHHPACPALERYVELYQAVVEHRGGNPRLGRQLLALADGAGLEDVEVEVVISLHRQGGGKRIAEMTLADLADTAVATGLAERGEIDRLIAEIAAFRRDPLSQIAIAPTFQVVGRVPERDAP